MARRRTSDPVLGLRFGVEQAKCWSVVVAGSFCSWIYDDNDGEGLFSVVGGEHGGVRSKRRCRDEIAGLILVDLAIWSGLCFWTRAGEWAFLGLFLIFSTFFMFISIPL